VPALLSCGPEIYVLEAPVVIPPPAGPVSLVDGWDDAPGSGLAFITNQIAIADRDRGLDLDGRCDEDGCFENVLWRLGELGNDQLRQGLLTGDALMLFEIAGLDRPYSGDDPEVTLKVYSARDADDPFYAPNNFKIPPGQSRCCEFAIAVSSIDPSTAQARNRLRAKIEGGTLTTTEPAPISFVLAVDGKGGPESRVERAGLRFELPATLDELNEGVIGGALPASVLAGTANPYCKTVSPRCPQVLADSTMLDLVSSLIDPRPDIDLDDDGPECLLDGSGDGLVDLCCDGTCEASQCQGRIVEPFDPARPDSCARTAAIADGYSIGFTLTAVKATIVGVAP
jgi:hypothetical protein